MDFQAGGHTRRQADVVAVALSLAAQDVNETSDRPHHISCVEQNVYPPDLFEERAGQVPIWNFLNYLTRCGGDVFTDR